MSVFLRPIKPGAGRGRSTYRVHMGRGVVWSSWAWVMAVVGACAPSTPQPNGVVVAPDAVWEVAADNLDDVVAIADIVSRARLSPLDAAAVSRSGLEAVGVAPPIAVVGRGRGGVIVTATLVDESLLQAGLMTATPAGWSRRRLLGRVDAVVDEAEQTRALVRSGDGVLVAVLDPVDDLAEAAFIEALATGALVGPRRQPRGTTWRLRLAPPLTTVVGDLVEGEVVVKGRELLVRGVAPLRQSPQAIAVAAALRSASGTMSCVADDRAMLTMHLPAVPGVGAAVSDAHDALSELPGQLDAFDGRLTVALIPVPEGTTAALAEPASMVSVAVIGRPRAGGAAELRRSFVEAIGGRTPETRIVGGRTIWSLGPAATPWRRVSATVDDDVFALGVGADVVVDRVAAGGVVCPPSSRLVHLQGPAFSSFLRRAPAELRLASRLAELTGLDAPLDVIDAVEQATLEAAPSSDSTSLELRLSLSVRGPHPGP